MRAMLLKITLELRLCIRHPAYSPILLQFPKCIYRCVKAYEAKRSEMPYNTLPEKHSCKT